MRIKEFIQFIELLLNELLQSKRILAFPNGSNFGKPKLQVKCKGKTSFSFISTQRYRDTEDYLISLKTLYLCIFYLFARDPGSSPG